MTQLPPPPKQKVTLEPKEEEKKEDNVAEEKKLIKDSFGRQIKVPEKKEDGVLKDSYGRVLKTVEKKDEKKQVRMIAGQEEKKNSGEDENESFVKHQSFENFLIEKMKRCKDKHLPHQRCQNCATDHGFSYKVKYDCKEHRPFPLGMCNKCLPPTVVLQR